ncbi:hypothetical protein MRX96_027781 [Rhipicephalus microplus]
MPHKDLTGNICLFGARRYCDTFGARWSSGCPPARSTWGRPPTETVHGKERPLLLVVAAVRTAAAVTALCGDRPQKSTPSRRRRESLAARGTFLDPLTTGCPSKASSRRRGPLEISGRNDST